MQRHDRHLSYAGYPYPPQPQPQHKYATSQQTSSAFSASANPNEDWTKISDLAERRRIQNRIAQRNYRKKLKKRLEDLERRAASSSASPEQKPQELDASPNLQQRSPQPSPQTESSLGTPGSRLSSPQQFAGQYVSAPDDRGMFSHQYTRQLSTSPPPFSYASYPTTETFSYPQYGQHAAYASAPGTQADMPLFPPYLPPIPNSYGSHTTLPSIVQPTKQEYYAEEEINPFSMSYASMAGIDIPATNAYPHSPPLSNESFDMSTEASPLTFLDPFPASPNTPPLSPPLQMT